DQLVYTFSALIGNAIKFRGDAQPMIHVSATLRDRAWEFSVRDNGIGIDPRNSERVFGVFKRLNQDQFDGIGIGLPIVRRIIEQGGGRIWAESQSGNGSTFFFTWPKAKPVHARTARRIAAASQAVGAHTEEIGLRRP